MVRNGEKDFHSLHSNSEHTKLDLVLGCDSTRLDDIPKRRENCVLPKMWRKRAGERDANKHFGLHASCHLIRGMDTDGVDDKIHKIVYISYIQLGSILYMPSHFGRHI